MVGRMVLLALMALVLPNAGFAQDKDNAALIEAGAAAAEGIQEAKAKLGAGKADSAEPSGTREIRKVRVTEVADAAVVIAPKGCSRSEKHWYGTSKKSIDCLGILLKGAKGSSDFNKDIAIGDILLIPAAESLNEAMELLGYLAAALSKNKASAGQQVWIDELTYLDAPFKISEVTKQAQDSAYARLGGIGIHVQTNGTLEGGATYQKNDNYRIGLGAK